MNVSLREEGAGRYAHLTKRRGSWSSTVITSRREEGAGRSAGLMLVCPCSVVSRFTTLYLGLRSLIVTFPRDIFVFSRL